MSLASIIYNLPAPLLNHWGYWIILFAAILETIPLFGLFIPGQTIVILGGFFARVKILDLGDVLWIAALGAIVGDLIGYLIGKFYGYSFIIKYGKHFAFKKNNYQKVKRLMHNHTGKAVIFGRFNSLTRAFAPFIAGVSDVSFFKFLFYNILGGVIWSVSFVLIGFIFGASYEIASKYIGRFITIATIIILLILFLYYFISIKNKAKRNIS